MNPRFWFYFHSPFPKAEGFSAYRWPGLLVHVPVILIFASLGAWLCAGEPLLYPFFLVYAVVGVYLGRDLAIMAHYNGLIALAVPVAAFLLIGAHATWPQPAPLAGVAVAAAVALLFGWYVNWRTSLESEDTPALHWIIRSKNLQAVARALEAGVDPDEKDRLIGREYAPLHVAVELSEKVEPARAMAAIELLVKHGADINALSDNGSALQLAVEQGQDAIARGLLALGADPRRANEHGKTPLRAAVRRGDREMIEALLAAGADINAQQGNRNVLGEAARAGHLALIPWLLDKGANAASDSDALEALASSKDPAVFDTMQRLIDLGAPVTDTLLMRAATPEMIRFVAARGARIDRLPPDKNPARVAGDAQNLAQRLRALRELGCDLAAADSHGETLLHDVARNVERMLLLPEVLAEVLPAGLDINAADTKGKTALYLMVERLLPYVTGRHIVGLKEKLPLRAAAELVAPLLSAGANPRIATKNGEDAVALAKRLKAPKGFLARLEQGANPTPKA